MDKKSMVYKDKDGTMLNISYLTPEFERRLVRSQEHTERMTRYIMVAAFLCLIIVALGALTMAYVYAYLDNLNVLSSAVACMCGGAG